MFKRRIINHLQLCSGSYKTNLCRIWWLWTVFVAQWSASDFLQVQCWNFFLKEGGGAWQVNVWNVAYTKLCNNTCIDMLSIISYDLNKKKWEGQDRQCVFNKNVKITYKKIKNWKNGVSKKNHILKHLTSSNWSGKHFK